MNFHFHLAKTDDEIRACFPVMHQLRLQFTQEGFLNQVRVQQQEGYQLAYAIAGEAQPSRVEIGLYTGQTESPGAGDNLGIVAVAGFIVNHKLAWGKNLYVDDLVTCQSTRSAGAGKAILDWLQDFARTKGCESFHLDSGVQRFGAHKFYLREGLHISFICAAGLHVASHHFQKQL